MTTDTRVIHPPGRPAASIGARLAGNFRNPALRARVLALAGGKLIGLALVLAAMRVYLPTPLYAQSGAPSAEINAINTMWVLLAAFLVFCMQVGFVMLEAGFARSRESVNILRKASSTRRSAE